MNCATVVVMRWLLFAAGTFGGIALGQVGLPTPYMPSTDSQSPSDSTEFTAANEEPLPTVLQMRPELAKQNLERFLRENCAACHGGRKSRVVPALNVLDMESLVEKRYVVWGKPEESFIVQRAKNREMPPRPNRLRQGEPILLASYVKQSEEPEAKDIFTVLDSDTRLTTVVDLVRTTGLVQELQQPGPLTILAPTNEAFDKLPEARRKSLMEARGEAFAVLLNHAVPWGTPLSASDLEQRRRVSSAALCELRIARTATGQLKIGNAIVVQADIQCSNGVIHVIDRVLLPGEPPPGEEAKPPHSYFTKNGIKMIEIPGGTFQMGTAPPLDPQTKEEGPVHSVTISPFYASTHEVTGAQYSSLMGNPAKVGVWARPLLSHKPVGKVSWIQAALFCNQLSILEGRAEYYMTVADGNDTIVVGYDWGGNGYRLLTEAEWEYAARAGGTGDWCFGSNAALLGDYCWYVQNALVPGKVGWEPKQIGLKLPNAFGLYDMHGNVAEWCQDFHGPYSGEPQTDPHGPIRGERRVYRGGSYLRNAAQCRSAARVGQDGGFRHDGLGFRVACTRNVGDE
jgi:formylglycine-generating enzyme required for sulfatase activity/uncharacterized surface protein with fasciclin (FAS1) repeats